VLLVYEKAILWSTAQVSTHLPRENSVFGEVWLNMIMIQKNSNRGGARPGAGRPRGTTHKVTVQGLIDQVAARSGGQDYTELLVEDFLRARLENDRNLTLKYHNLISSKVLADRIDIEVNEDEDTVTAKRAAFAAAIAAVAGLPQPDK